jgi:cysteine synthase
MKYNSILETIGKTPLIRLNKLYEQEAKKNVEVWAKVERFNPGSSIKDRIALSMVESAESEGILKEGTTIIEPTSGNTGIGLALVAAVKKYSLILVMPDSMSMERRKILTAYGAELVLTPASEGMTGAISKARELTKEKSPAWMPMQFENAANPDIHSRTTAIEIIDDFPDGIDYLICGVGTGGHITGCARKLKQEFSNLKVYAVEPSDSAILSGGSPGPHAIQGIGAGFIPQNYDGGLIDGTITITKEEAFTFTQRASKEEGLFVGISSGAALAAVSKHLKHVPEGGKVVTFCYDTGERYLSVDGLF